MTLRPTDMLEIQSAIDAYERKFPRRPAPTAEVALAWRLGKKEWARRQATQQMAQKAGDDAALSSRSVSSKSGSTKRVRTREKFEQPRTRGLFWLLGQMRLRWQNWCDDLASSDVLEDSPPLVKGALRVGLYGVAAVLVASVFVLGAIVGGFK
ncbi:MAG: hypothetical protein WA510_32105 [Acidobacteriaceae bacterium]